MPEFDIQNQNVTQSVSEFPALGDQNAMNAYKETQMIKGMGYTPVPQQPAQPAPQAPVQQVQTPQPQVAPQAPKGVTAEQLQALEQRNNARLQQMQLDMQRQIAASRAPNMQQNAPIQLTAAEQNFLAVGTQRGYSQEQLYSVIFQNRAKAAAQQNVMEQRIANLEKQRALDQESTLKENFIQKATAFGDKWRMTEQDLVYFVEFAAKNGFDCTNPGVSVEMMDNFFRGFMPDQYAIRSQKLNPQNKSQIIGGTGYSEATRQQADRAADALVDAYLRSKAPNTFDRYLRSQNK